MKRSRLEQILRLIFRVISQNIKLLILLVSFGTFLYLVINTMKSSAFRKNTIDEIPLAARNDDKILTDIVNYQKMTWGKDVVEIYRKQLGLKNDNSISEHDDERYEIDCPEERIITAFSGDGIENYMWEYISLMGIMQTWQNNRLKIKVYITEQTKMELEQYLESVEMDTIDSIPSNCYNLEHAQIAGDITDLETVLDGNAKSIVILKTNTKRFQEVLDLNLSELRSKIKFRDGILSDARYEFIQTKTLLEIETDSITVVGLYLGFDMIPTSFYTLSMTYFRRDDPNIIFLILCDSKKMSYCSETFANEKNVRLMEMQSDQFYDFTLLTLCNSSIVSNTFGILPALLNEGDTTVYTGNNNKEYYIPALIADSRYNWFVLG